MQMNHIIEDFLVHQAGGMIITNEAGQVVYKTDNIEISGSLARQIARRAGNAFTGKRSSSKWEYSNSDTAQFFRVRSSVEEADGQRFFCSLFTDLSDYAILYKEIAEYSRRISDISDFQANLLGKMSESYEYCLADICSFFHNSEAILFVTTLDEQQIIRIQYKDESYTRDLLAFTPETEEYLFAGQMDLIGDSICLFSGEAGGRYYSLYIAGSANWDEHSLTEASVYNVIRLYIENGILRERIIFENEHDHLTGLYNKGKYMELMEAGFFSGCPLTIFNLDLNDLKHVNDTLGHEAGDHLIRLAAKSILSVTSENVIGFRLGGDEFALLCKGMLPEEAVKLRKRWDAAVQKINEKEPELHLVIACGIASGDAGCNPDKLMEEADVEMYMDKRRLKKLTSQNNAYAKGIKS